MKHLARFFLVSGAIVAGLAVAAGAFGAHALQARLEPGQLAIWRTAAEYQFFHGLGLLFTGMLGERFPGVRLFCWAGWIMLLGVVLFSGSLYGLALAGLPLGIVNPFGGLSFLAAWACVALGALRAQR